ncbi:hypothetical protein AAK894_13010 [Lachnospiraceae bacterium 46-61]
MKYLKYNTPLTEQQKIFATENHALLYKFLVIHHLDNKEWYDVVAIAYIKAVQSWFKREDLHKYRFSVIAFRVMSAYVCHEIQRQKRQIQTISLDSMINSEFDNMTYHDTITNKNKKYIQYMGSDDVKVGLIRNYKPEKIKSKDTLIIEAFLDTDEECLVFEFETIEEARRKSFIYRSLRNRTNSKDIYNVKQRKNSVYIERL